MKNQDLLATLTAAIDHLTAAAEARRPDKPQREGWAAFVEQTRATLAADGAQEGQPAQMVWRIAEVINPKTGKLVVLEVRREGHLGASDATRFGLVAAPSWVEVRAASRVEARARIAQGEGARCGQAPPTA